MRNRFGGRARALALTLGIGVALGGGALVVGAPVDAGENGVRRMMKDVRKTVRDLKRSVCQLYVLTDNVASLPAFCPEPPPPDVCELPIEPGPCRAAIPRWGFDPALGRCRLFSWGGCGGNANRFPSEAECEMSCPADPVPLCEQPADPGPCEAYIPSWYFDSTTGRCEQFVYGGCQGNENRFESAEECARACASPDVCELPPDVGPCDAAIPRWYHDPQDGCREFVWGGCGGNGNNFETLEECEARCSMSLCDDLACGEDQECRLWVGPCHEQNCQLFPSGPLCPPCEPIAYCADVCTPDRCDEGQICRLLYPPCLPSQPCPPVAVCVDVPCPRACQPGSHCELQHVVCVTEPCPPIAVCVPD